METHAANGHGSRHQQQRHLGTMGGHFVAALGEFVGTFLFLYMAYGGHLMIISTESGGAVAGGASSTTFMWIAFAYGFSLLVNVWAFYRISGGLFNPAVTLGLCLTGGVPWLRGALFLFPAQLLASLCAGGLVEAMFPGNVADVNTYLNASTSQAQGVFLEMFFTSQLVIVVLMLAKEKSRDTFLAPIGIGLALFVAMIPGVWVTGGSLNPVRSFGCAAAGRSFPSYHWIYWIGPCLGALLASGFYWLMKYLHYEEANPGQDAPHPDAVEP
ncbi:aquaporin-like protein [Plectosphaerella plurivora]|uniref:Aquaporin-like protein n=1 Tax=Plectosphaerella plurivora TaxID=936078 RepID=A0A9P8VHW8_9PEZI|nr:aquaporin-like protein [Plectosphaerella plurivora]